VLNKALMYSDLLSAFRLQHVLALCVFLPSFILHLLGFVMSHVFTHNFTDSACSKIMCV